ncbi:hypothetical protein D3C76_193530 [compost metagenome]
MNKIKESHNYWAFLLFVDFYPMNSTTLGKDLHAPLLKVVGRISFLCIIFI